MVIVMNVQAPYKRANRLFHPDNTIIKVDDQSIGGKYKLSREFS